MKKNIPPEEIALALETIQATTRLLEMIYSSDEDIHRYTAQLGKIYHEIFYPIDQQLELSSYSPDRTNQFESVVTTLLDINLCNERDASDLNAILHKIRNHNLIESETGLNPQELLTRIYDLIQQPIFVYSQDTLLSVLIENLEHNLKAGGGCLAGICARLTQMYFSLLSDFLNTMHIQIQNDMIISEPENQDFDSEMALGLALSHHAYESEQNSLYLEFEKEFSEVLPQFQYLKDLSSEDFSNLLNDLDPEQDSDHLILAWHQLNNHKFY